MASGKKLLCKFHFLLFLIRAGKKCGKAQHLNTETVDADLDLSILLCFYRYLVSKQLKYQFDNGAKGHQKVKNVANVTALPPGVQIKEYLSYQDSSPWKDKCYSCVFFLLRRMNVMNQKATYHCRTTSQSPLPKPNARSHIWKLETVHSTQRDSTKIN